MREMEILAIFVLYLTAATTAGAEAVTSSVEDYRMALGKIADSLERNDLEEARRVASTLRGAEIRFGEETFLADPTLLTPLASASTLEGARAHLPRLRALMARLNAGYTGDHTAGPAADLELLEHLRAQQEIATVSKGGNVPGVELRFPERVRKWLWDAWAWLTDVFWKIVKWLSSLWPSSQIEGTNITGLVTLLTVAAALLLGLLGFYVLRRSRGGAASVSVSASPVVTTDRDADPTARNSNEWADYALELASEGRAREAIRAWYHAVLVTLYRAGLLHYRKGRTNWEYAFSLSPSVPWRPRFLDITQTFDDEWYGRTESSTDALGHFRAEATSILRQVEGRGLR